MHRPILPRLRSFGAVVTIISLTLPAMPVQAKTRKGDRLLAEARTAESKGDYDKAMTFAVQAMSSDPSDAAYQLEIRRVRFEAASYHVTHGQQLRTDGDLSGALSEFQKAYEIDPASDIAEQEIRHTKRMIEREEQRRKNDPNGKTSPEDVSLTPAQEERKRIDDRVASLLPVPELRPLNTQPLILKMKNTPRILFETVGNLAGINVLFDPDYEQQQQNKMQMIDLVGTTLEESLAYLAVVTHSFWKPLSSNTIFITQENPTKRREYEDEVVKVFYLSNITSPTELQEMITTLRQVIEVNKLFNYSSQNAIVIRAEPAKMALAEKIIADLDKPKSEVLIDVMVMEVNSTRSRQLAAAFAPTGINTTVAFTPRGSLQTLPGQLGSSSGGGSGFNNNPSATTPAATTPAASGTTDIPLLNAGRIGLRDYSLTNVPGGLIQAVLNDSGTRVLQRPELRALDNFKAELKIGDRIPTASGSFQPGVGGVGINPLVNTQFTYIDTGVNLAITPRVHDNGEVTLHMDIDISQVSNYVNLGGIQQPVISQRKSTVDVRMRDGQINMIGGLMQITNSKTTSGIPGLASIPILNRLFTSDQTTETKDELLISMVPHIVRGPDVTQENLRGVYAGNSTNYEVRFAPRKNDGPLLGDGPAAPTNVAAVTLPVQGPTPSSVAATARIGFAPSQLDAQSGSTFTVAVRADNVTDLLAVETQLKFDPKLLKINSIQAGDMLQQGGLSLQPNRNIQNETGDASANLARDAAKGPAKGSGALILVTFQAIGKGQAAVSIPLAVLHDSTGGTSSMSAQPLTVNVK